MKKEIKRFDVKFDFEWEYGVAISKMKEDLDKLEKLGATHIDIDSYENYDCTYVSIEGYVNREETDDEYLKRTNEQLKIKNNEKIKELAELKRLTDKYSG